MASGLTHPKRRGADRPLRVAQPKCGCSASHVSARRLAARGRAA